jgi:hypothetical protein
VRSPPVGCYAGQVAFQSEKGITVKLRFIRLLIFVIVFFSSITRADDSNTDQRILSVAKFTGGCGILESMVHFQKATQMPGGDNFIARFWTTEATRIGFSMQEYVDNCNKSTDIYNQLWKASKTPKQ